MAVFQFGNVPREVVNNHLIIVSKVGFQDLWISGVIEMMTPLNLFCFGDGVQFGLPSEIRFAYQSADNLSTTFKARGKTPLPCN